MFKFKREIIFLIAILTIFLMGVALSAVPTETWYGIKIFDDGLYVGDANTIAIDPNGFTSSVPFNDITITDPGATGATLTIVTGQTLYCPADAEVSGTNTGDQDLDGKVDQSSGKSATIHNSIDLYGTDDTSITFPSETSTLVGLDPNSKVADSYIYDKHENLDANSIGLGVDIDSNYALKTAADIYCSGDIILEDTATQNLFKIEVTNGEIYATQL
jgi:hypothetical protein